MGLDSFEVDFVDFGLVAVRMRLVQLVEQQLQIVQKLLAVDCWLDHDYFLNVVVRTSVLSKNQFTPVLYDTDLVHIVISMQLDCTHRQNFDSSFGKTDFEDIDGLVSYRVLNMSYYFIGHTVRPILNLIP